ncbi:MAG TPA: biotin synthase BioB [Candidatus Tumulicola sp.]|nr:biotin synthase BioB [Candidatus Tumulicola sp.]
MPDFSPANQNVSSVIASELFSQLDDCIATRRPAARDVLLGVLRLADSDRDALLARSLRMRLARAGAQVNLEGIVSAKTGACSEDCSFCSQSARYSTGIAVRPLMQEHEAVEAALRAQRNGASEFCLVIAVRGPSERVLEQVIRCVKAVRDATPLKLAVSLGIMSPDQVARLKAAGVAKINHNLESGPRFFSTICSTHTYEERLETCRAVKAAGLELCSGGIFGMGENLGDRVDLACDLQRLEPEEVPVNFLDPRPGTPLGDRPLLEFDEALRAVAMMRFALPSALIRLSGGRERTLAQNQALGLVAGADGLIIGDYLTTAGQSPDADKDLAQEFARSYRAWSA